MLEGERQVEECGGAGGCRHLSWAEKSLQSPSSLFWGGKDHRSLTPTTGGEQEQSDGGVAEVEGRASSWVFSEMGDVPGREELTLLFSASLPTVETGIQCGRGVEASAFRAVNPEAAVEADRLCS